MHPSRRTPSTCTSTKWYIAFPETWCSRNNVIVTGCYAFRTIVSFSLLCVCARSFAFWADNKTVNPGLLSIPCPPPGLEPKPRPKPRHRHRSDSKSVGFLSQRRSRTPAGVVLAAPRIRIRLGFDPHLDLDCGYIRDLVPSFSETSKCG